MKNILGGFNAMNDELKIKMYSLISQGAYPGITFQRNPEYVPPVWPEKPEAQQQMAHLDFAVNNLEEAVHYAVQCGATIAPEQFSDSWRVIAYVR